MRKYKLFMAVLILIFPLLTALPIQANSAEPPGLLIVVENAPEDMRLAIQFDEQEIIELRVERKAWETYYRYYYHLSEARYDVDFTKAKLIVSSENINFSCDLPAAAFETYNNLLQLNLKTQTVEMGISPYRAPLLVSMRVSLTLVIEGIVFFLFGYRQKKSWQIFLITNLLTQGFVNIMLSKSIANSYAIIIYFILEMLVVLFELIPYMAFIDEHKKIRNFFTCLIANAASLVLGAWIITHLPI